MKIQNTSCGDLTWILLC